MANRYRGEVDAVLSGKPYTLCLTLGALAELESAFEKRDLVELAERFSKGRLSAGEAIRILHLGLKGAGHEMTREDVARLSFEGGAAGAVRLVSELLAATFGADEDRDKSSGVKTSTSLSEFDASASNGGDAPRP